MDDQRLETIKRRSDERKLEIGEEVLLKDGHVGVVLARYIPSTHKDEVRYLVQVQSKKDHKRTH